MAKKFETIEDIQAEIDRLQDEIAKKVDTERTAVIERVSQAMLTYKISWKDIADHRKNSPTGPEAEPVQGVRSSRSEKMRGRVKYRLNDKAWSGFGRQPVWVRDYLSASKKNKLENLLTEEFK